MQFSEQDIRAICRSEMKRVIGGSDEPNIEFLPTGQAFSRLGYPSQNELRKAISNGILRVGKEVQDRRSDESSKPNYYFNIPACIQRLDTPPEKRA